MPTISFNISGSFGPLSIQSQEDLIVDTIIAHEETLPIAKAGALSTHTDTTSGEITASSSEHEIETADTIDLYWTDATTSTTKRRYGVTVGAVSGTAIPFSGGYGDDLPTAGSAIRVAPILIFRSTFVGNDVDAIYIGCDQDATIDFRDAVGSEWVVKLSARGYELWQKTKQENPVGDAMIAEICCSNGSVVATATIKIGIGENVAP